MDIICSSYRMQIQIYITFIIAIIFIYNFPIFLHLIRYSQKLKIGRYL